MLNLNDIISLISGALIFYLYLKFNKIENFQYFDPFIHCKQGSLLKIAHMEQCAKDVLGAPILVPASFRR